MATGQGRKATPGIVIEGIEHGGSGTGYSYWGCRCQKCIVANRRRSKRRYLERCEELRNNPDLKPHGVTSTHDNWGCRCDACVVSKCVDNLLQAERRKAKKVRAKGDGFSAFRARICAP